MGGLYWRWAKLLGVFSAHDLREKVEEAKANEGMVRVVVGMMKM